MRILHTMLRVGDLEKSLAFYTEVLGMKLLRQARVPDGLVADFPQALDGVLVRRDVRLLSCHAPSMTTAGCHVKRGLSGGSR